MRIKFNRIYHITPVGLTRYTSDYWVHHDDIKTFEKIENNLLCIVGYDDDFFISDTYTGEELAEKLDNIEKLNNS